MARAGDIKGDGIRPRIGIRIVNRLTQGTWSGLVGLGHDARGGRDARRSDQDQRGASHTTFICMGHADSCSR